MTRIVSGRDSIVTTDSGDPLRDGFEDASLACTAYDEELLILNLYIARVRNERKDGPQFCRSRASSVRHHISLRNV